MKTSRSGFTIIELLVVIVVISVLASLVFSVYMRSKEKGRQTQCLSNLRQLGQASLMYAQENNGLFPPYVNEESTPQRWESIPIHGGYPLADHLNAALMPYVNNRKIFYCPTDPYAGKSISVWAVYHLYSSYAYRFSSDATITDDGHTEWFVARNENEVVHVPPSEYVLILETNNDYKSGLPNNAIKPEANVSGCEHFGQRNCVYADGHTASLK